MSLPFDATQFFGVFARYNAAVWPAQIILVALAVTAIALAARESGWSDSVASGMLAVLWLWMGAVYHIGFFRSINPAATLFGAVFALQGIALAISGTVKGRLRFRFQGDVQGSTGALLMGFSLLGYPLLGYVMGHQYPATPTFGLPCPTTIFTLGLLLWARPTPPAWVLIVPLAWSAVGASAAFQLGVHEDLSLPVAGLVTGGLVLARRMAVSTDPGQLVPR